MKPGKLTWLVLAVYTAAQLLTGCQEIRERLLPLPVNPKLVINNDSASTRDTLLRVTVKDADQYTTMQYNSSPSFNGMRWSVYDSQFTISVPPLEGMAKVYARFAAPCCTSGISVDSIRLDFTATIDSLGITADDTLSPDRDLFFHMQTGEEGTAEVSFGRAIVRHPLQHVHSGRFAGSLRIRNGMAEDSAQVTGWFTDRAGNEATPFVLDKRYYVRGPALNPVKIGSVEAPVAGGNDILAKNGYCYVSNGNVSKITIFTTLNRQEPALLPNGVVTTMGWSYGIDEGAGLLHVAAGSNGLLTIFSTTGDVGNIDRSIRVPGSPRDVVAKPPLLYVSALFDGLKIFRVAPETDPVIVSELGLEYSGEYIELDDDIAYIAGGGGVSVVDVSNINNPKLIQQIPVPREPSGLICDDRRLIIPCSNGDLFLADIHNPYKPVLLPQWKHFSKIHGIAYSSPFLFISEEYQITIINASDPDLGIVAKITDSKNCRAICISEEHLYVSTGTGLDIYRLYGQ